MGFVAGAIGLLIIIFMFARFWPILLLGLVLISAHAGGKNFGNADWQNWEWGLVALAVFLQASLSKSR